MDGGDPMKKVYDIVLSTVGPVHIGNSISRSKLQYVHDYHEKTVYIPDDVAMMTWIIKKGKSDSFEQFFMGRNGNLFEWMKQNNLLKEYKQYMAYAFSTDSLKLSRNVSLNDISETVKTADHQPYIPGSSLKGALRTALFAKACRPIRMDHPHKANFLRKPLRSRQDVTSLSREGRRLEREIFQESENATRSIMKNILISDSDPVSAKNLILAQKVDSFRDNGENSISNFREAIRPDTKIRFQMTLKEDFEGGIQRIIEAIEYFYSEINYNFLQHLDVEERQGNWLYIGGGSGYVSKTVTYPLLEDYGESKDGYSGLEVVSNILDINFIKHKHRDDVDKGVSPRALKTTYVNGKRYEMGLCTIEFKEKDSL